MSITIHEAQSLIENGQAVKGDSRWALPLRLYGKRLQYLSPLRGWKDLRQASLRERYSRESRFTVVELPEGERKEPKAEKRTQPAILHQKKVCGVCEKPLGVRVFRADRSNPDGLKDACRAYERKTTLVKCKACKRDLPVDAYRRVAVNDDGRRYTCNECRTAKVGRRAS